MCYFSWGRNQMEENGAVFLGSSSFSRRGCRHERQSRQFGMPKSRFPQRPGHGPNINLCLAPPDGRIERRCIACPKPTAWARSAPACQGQHARSHGQSAVREAPNRAAGLFFFFFFSAAGAMDTMMLLKAAPGPPGRGKPGRRGPPAFWCRWLQLSGWR